MIKKLFTQIYDEKKRQVNISIDYHLKAKLMAQKATDGISISEKVESLYRNHQKAVVSINVPKNAFPRSRGERGKPMFSDTVRSRCGIFLTNSAINFFDLEAKKKGIDRSKIIELALKIIYHLH